MRWLLSVRSIPFLYFALLIAPQAPASQWWEDALRLTGESDQVRNQAIARLKARGDLEETLRRELNGPHKAHALDVIATLQLSSFLPELLKMSRRDENGALTLVINSLITDDNRRRIASEYRRRLQRARTQGGAPTSQVIMVDTLGRMGAILPPEEVRALFKSPHPEVRSAGVYYIRLMTLKHRKNTYLPLLEQALSLSPYQARLRALSLMGELPPEWRAQVLPFTSVCTEDRNEHVRRVCRDLTGGPQ